MPTSPYQILYWYDIPVQVRAGRRRHRTTIQLPDRFQDAVDRAAMAAGLTGSDDYVEGFAWGESISHEGESSDVAKSVAAELEAAFPIIDWRETARKLKANNKADF